MPESLRNVELSMVVCSALPVGEAQYLSTVGSDPKHHPNRTVTQPPTSSPEEVSASRIMSDKSKMSGDIYAAFPTAACMGLNVEFHSLLGVRVPLLLRCGGSSLLKDIETL